MLAGCGGSRQDANEPTGTFPVAIAHASFPPEQRLARQVEMRVAVKNTGNKAIPDVALTVLNPGNGRSAARAGAFGQAIPTSGSGADLADPTRPIWILDAGPRDGDTAYDGTWALGKLAPHKIKAFLFRVTPVRAGRYTLTYRVAAGLDGKAKASFAGGGPARGSFTVHVSRTPGSAVADTRGGG